MREFTSQPRAVESSLLALLECGGGCGLYLEPAQNYTPLCSQRTLHFSAVGAEFISARFSPPGAAPFGPKGAGFDFDALPRRGGLS
jgi:hypothetical protein